MAKKKRDEHPAPAHLGSIAKECWRDSIAQLQEIGLLHTADFAALEMYCSAYERYRLAEAKVQKEGDTIFTKNGYPLTAPWVTSLHRNLEVCRRCQCQYGLTPASRAKINVVKKQGQIPPEWKGLFGE